MKLLGKAVSAVCKKCPLVNTERYKAWFNRSSIESERDKGEVSPSEFEKFISQTGPVNSCNVNFLKGFLVIASNLFDSFLLR